MVKKITLHLFLLFSLSLNAQNWLCFKTDAISHFKSSHGYIASVRIDSTFIDTNYTDYVSYYMIRSGLNAQVTTRGASWIGEKFRFMNSGENLLYNADLEEIKIKQAVLSDSYQLFRSDIKNLIITAHVDTIKEENFLGLSDSLAYISMTSTDTLGNNIVNPCNNYIIRLSKNYGLLTALNFYKFPFLNTNGFYEFPTDTLNLVGMDSPQIGWQNIGSKDIFDWEVGDEFHTYYHFQPAFGPNPANTSRKYMIRKVIDKTITSDSLFYKIERCYFQKTDNYVTNYHNQIKVFDTINERYGLVSKLDHLSYEIFQDDFHKLYVKTDSTIIDHSMWHYNIQANNEGDPVLYTGGGGNTWIKGLGNSPYWYDNDGDDSEIFVYYKKGNLEWGTPYNCETLGIPSIQNKSFKIYPNPTSDKIYLELENKQLEILNCSIRDLSGKEVLLLKNNISEIDLSTFENGIYMLNFETENGNYFYKISKQ